MTKNRLEAFSDGVIAIIITIMVLELKVPHDASWNALVPIAPVFFSYVFSFIFLGIYWSNHHHLLQVVEHVNGRVLWANLHLLFWLSLTPFVTGWMGENKFAAVPVALYGLPLDYYNNYVQSVEAVTQADVTRVAQQYINPGSLAIVIVGDRKTIEEALKSTNIGPISIRDMRGQPIQ